MAQGSLTINDGSGVTMLDEFNAAFAALGTWSSGAADPAQSGFAVPLMWWIDTGNKLVKQRTAANDAWVPKGILLDDGTIQWYASSSWVAGETHTVGDICYPQKGSSYIRLECTVTGTSGTTEPIWGNPGSTVMDGGVTWAVRDLRVATNAADAKTKLATIAIVESMVPAGVPVGGIIMWSGTIANIPANWALCNGQNNTPNLQDRFVVGAGGAYGVGAIGGESSHTLSWNEMPYHSHDLGCNAGEFGAGYSAGHGISWSGGGGSPPVTATQAAGGGWAHNNLPPYYAICYIMRMR